MTGLNYQFIDLGKHLLLNELTNFHTMYEATRVLKVLFLNCESGLDDYHINAVKSLVGNRRLDFIEGTHFVPDDIIILCYCESPELEKLAFDFNKVIRVNGFTTSNH